MEQNSDNEPTDSNKKLEENINCRKVRGENNKRSDRQNTDQNKSEGPLCDKRIWQNIKILTNPNIPPGKVKLS